MIGIARKVVEMVDSHSDQFSSKEYPLTPADRIAIRKNVLEGVEKLLRLNFEEHVMLELSKSIIDSIVASHDNRHLPLGDLHDISIYYKWNVIDFVQLYHIVRSHKVF